MSSPKLVELRQLLSDFVQFDMDSQKAEDIAFVEMCLHEVGHVMTMPAKERNQVFASPFTAHLVGQMLIITEKDHNHGEMAAMAISLLIAQEFLTDREMDQFRVQAEGNLLGNLQARHKDPQFYLDAMNAMEESKTNKARAKFAIRQITKMTAFGEIAVRLAKQLEGK